MSEAGKKRGGARPGAGRKPKLEKHATEIQKAEKQCADRLPKTIAMLEKLANGEVEQTEEEWVAAGTVTLGRGANAKLAFPNLPPDQLVLIRKRTVTFSPDAKVNIYLADRVMGKPADGDDIKISEIVGAELDAIVEKIREVCDPATAEKIIEALASDHPGEGG
jgi:hypothetical protein